MAKGDSSAADAAEELQVLFPDVAVKVTDPETRHPVDLEVREFRFREGLEVQAIARPLIEALADGIEGDGALEAEAIAGALAVHADLWIELVARACGVKPEWVAGLADQDGDALSDAMWSANGRFFTRRVIATVAARARRRAVDGSRSQRSSTPSSGPDTDEGTGT